MPAVILSQKKQEAIYLVNSNHEIIQSCIIYMDNSSDADPITGSICDIICEKGKVCDKCFIDEALVSDSYITTTRKIEGHSFSLRAWSVMPGINCDKVVIVFWQDTTDQLNMEAQLFHSQKLEAIGELAAGVAHEINNPIGFIYGNLKIMQEYSAVVKKVLDISRQIPQADAQARDELIDSLAKLDEAESLEDIMTDIDGLLSDSLNGSARVAEIVSNLKSFARPDSNEKKEYNVNAGLQVTLKILNNEVKYKCEVVEDYGDVGDIICYPGELNQVFINIIANAAQSIEDHGQITVKTWQEDGFVKVMIKDDGCGMDTEVISSIFDPFYTTKPVGEGTGLGLSVSHGIVEKHGGSIKVESEKGIGTSFIVSLPLPE